MNKFNIFFLSLLTLAAPSIFGGMQQAIKDARAGFKGASEKLKEADNNHNPKTWAENTEAEMEGLNQDAKGFGRATEGIVNGAFEFTETLGGLVGYKKRYNNYINTLNKLRVSAKQTNQELKFDEADFQDLIEQELAELQKQKPVQKSAPVKQGRFATKNNTKPVTAAQTVTQTKVNELKQAVTNFNNARNNQGVAQQQPQAQNKKGVKVVNRRMTVDDARKALNEKVDAFKTMLENKREQACAKSTAGEFVYGGSSIRKWAITAVVALGALYFGESIKDTATGKTVSKWFTEGQGVVKNICNNIYEWFTSKVNA